ncbi:MAG: bleomycin resistance protein [Flavobacteriaceae bacterium]|nr:bleomycin resistance protein [Flavobacteriaceae bacterium]
MAPSFHLSLPCKSISKTREFYVSKLGASTGRSAQNWIDINLYGHQITFTRVGVFKLDSPTYSLSGIVLPSFHFGIVLTRDEWNKKLEILKKDKTMIQSEVDFLSDKVGEHRSFFVKDPNDYMVEFKSFKDSEEIFKT